MGFPAPPAAPMTHGSGTLHRVGRSGVSTNPAAVLVRPVSSLWRLRVRISLDLLVTLAVTALAIGLAVAYQLVGRWSRRDGA